MCGIAGIIADKKTSQSTIKSMVDRLIHRGPDDDGYLIEENFAFGMRRLSIIDLNRGKQPITNEDGSIVVVFNGEIYNYKELCVELKKKGHVFVTESDTECLVHLYEEYGEKMVEMLRGMFGFSIYDRNKNILFIARDQFGIKPLYYRVDDGGPNHTKRVVAYASEIKALLADSRYKPDVNREAVGYYLQFQYDPLEETFFRDIYVLLPGHTMTIYLDKFATGEVLGLTSSNPGKPSYVINKYWEYKFDSRFDRRFESKINEAGEKKLSKKDKKQLEDAVTAEISEEIFRKISDSVEHHMISDVPVGAFLSGGVDSAIIVTLMQKFRMEKGLDPVQTFTIGFDEVSEHSGAREVAEKIRTKHTEIHVGFDEYLAELPKIAWHFDQPVADPSAVALYFLAREARKQVKVVLSGEGADELFGGYNIYREPFSLKPIAILPNFIKNLFVRPLANLLSLVPFNFYGKNYFRRAITPINERYIGNARIFTEREVELLYRSSYQNSENWKLFSTTNLLKTDFDGFAKNPENSGGPKMPDSRKMQLIDIKYWLPGDILAKADKMTMAHSLESRVPFLDMEVFKISASIPDFLKYQQGTTKYILRQAFKAILPETTTGRKKLGFPTPIKYWLKNPKSADRIENYILANNFIKTDFDLIFIKNLFAQHKHGRTDNSRKIFVLLMMSLWYDVYIENNEPKLL